MNSTEWLRILIECLPGFFVSLGIAILFWILKKLTQMLKYVEQIPMLTTSIKETKIMAMYQFKRLDAQDCATEEIFQALKRGTINGEATIAVNTMKCARSESDEYLQKLFFNTPESCKL